MEKLVTKLKSDLKDLRQQIGILSETNKKLEINVKDLDNLKEDLQNEVLLLKGVKNSSIFLLYKLIN